MNYNLRSNTLFFPILLVFFLISIAPSQSEEPAAVSCDAENATAQISKNIGLLLPMLDTQNGSKLATYGQNESKVYGLAQCIGNVSNEACQMCIKNATAVIRGPKYCPFQSGALIWYNYCLLRYSNRSFFGEISDPTSDMIFYNTGKVTHYKDFNRNLTALMKNTTDEALASPEGFGSGSIKLPRDEGTIYGLLQCTKDLIDPSYKRCGQCLYQAQSNLKHGKVCYNRQGCLVFIKGCILRYELYPFEFNSNGTSAAGSYDYVKDVIKD